MRLDVDAIRSELGPRAPEWELIYLSEVDSTNRVARELTRPARRRGLAVLTDHQTAGRGRQGRTWIDPPETGILTSVAVEWPFAIPVSYSTMAASLAVLHAVETSGVAGAGIKWPNDIVVGHKKLCGILAERVADGDRVVIGTGINVLGTPGDGGVTGVTSVVAELGHGVSRERLIALYLGRLGACIGSLPDGEGDLFDSWRTRVVTVGQPVRVVERGSAWEGTAVGVANDGALRVRVTSGEETLVYAGDVSVRQRDFT